MGVYDWVIPDFLAGKCFVVFDLETTGLDPKKDKIVEIGAVKFNQCGIIARFSVLINPGIPMPAAASQVNHITDDMLKGKPLLHEVLPDFLRFIQDSVLIAHNASFDSSFVNEVLASMFKPSMKNDDPSKQPSLLDDEFVSDQNDGGWLAPFSSMPNRIVDTIPYAKQAFPGRWKYNLQDLSRDLGIQALDAHRAEDDARVCMEIFLKCIAQIRETAA
ncbi:MAG: 3'-5' exonuclease [Treponema sp.]|jgi:DNA polymerase-3 subunit epsilon|nr:3'-5' exonuclease [Treponema sp.]